MFEAFLFLPGGDGGGTHSLRRLWLLAPLLLLPLLPQCGLFFFPDTSGIITNPATRNQLLAPGEDIFVQFPFAVETTAAERAFKIKEGGRGVNGFFRWQGNTLFFVPTPQLTWGWRYTLEFRGTVNDRRGRPYRLELEIPFFYVSESEPPLTIESSSPASGAKVTPHTPLSVSFSKAVDRARFSLGFTLSPQAETSSLWSEDGRTVTLTPRQEWQNLTLYRARLSREIRDLRGLPLEKEAEILFLVDAETGCPSVAAVETALKDWEGLFPSLSVDLNTIRYDEAIKIHFSAEMDPVKTESAFSLSPYLPGAKIWLDRRTLVFAPEAGFLMGTQYLLVILKTAADLSGLPMEQDYTLCFTPDIPVLRVTSINGRGEDGFPIFSFSTTQPMEIGVGEAPFMYTFSFSFGQGFASTQEKQAAQRMISITCLFPPEGGDPVAISHGWLWDTVLNITYSQFRPQQEGKEQYYLLKIPGGPGGVRNSCGSFMEKDVEQLLRSRE